MPHDSFKKKTLELLEAHSKDMSPIFKYEPKEVYQAFHDVITAYDEEEEIELIKMLGDPSTTLCQCLYFLMKNRNWKYPDLFKVSRFTVISNNRVTVK